MARILGILSLDGRPAQAALDAACAASGTTIGARAGQGPIALASTGIHPALLVSAGARALIVDGRLYNPEEVPGEGPLGPRLLDFAARHGLAALARLLNGDFALAFWDGEQLSLARDRFAVQPLYFIHQPGKLFAFASRPRPLLGLPGVSREPNRAFVARFVGSHYRTFDNDPDASPYADVAQLPAATCLRVDGKGLSREVFWSLAEQPDLVGTEEELAEQYRVLLLDSVARRVRGIDRLAFTLSGGMDSSSVLACATQALGAPQLAYSSVYEDPTYDETAEIRSMLDGYVSEWRPVKLGTPDLATIVGKMIEVNDEPVATATWLSHYLLCERVAKEGVRYLFGGLGGDELNAGEYEYFFFFFADLKRAGEEQKLRRETEQWAFHHDHPIFKKSPAVMEDGLRRLVDLTQAGRCLPDRARLLRYADTVQRDYYDVAAFDPVMDRPFSSYLKNRTYQDIYRETAPCCLRAADRHGEAFGIDIVWPFFDHRLVELMFRVPGTLKIRDGVTKILLRDAMKGILPEETRTRIKKTGWNAPAHVWFSGEGGQQIRDLVASRSFRERGLYNVPRISALLDEHEAIMKGELVKDNHMMFFWQLLNVELWLRSL